MKIKFFTILFSFLIILIFFGCSEEIRSKSDKFDAKCKDMMFLKVGDEFIPEECYFEEFQELMKSSSGNYNRNRHLYTDKVEETDKYIKYKIEMLNRIFDVKDIIYITTNKRNIITSYWKTTREI
jgi:hypothetical protein